jgi:succinate dehydrogenase / fumarate reductase cytochrome b subunit
MWLSNSSIGRKVVMSVTGLALILFLTFHMAMNLVALFSGEAYNMICAFLGANWYALVACVGLAALFVIHILYAFWLTIQNRAARGSERYAVNAKPKSVEWASQNMLVLGIIVIVGLALHFANFWYKMQFAEIIGQELGEYGATDGAAYIQATFGCPVFAVLYLVWLAALWFHLTHGFWSALQTLGWSNKVWFNRWRMIGNIYSTLVVLGFAAVVVIFFLKSLMGCGAC